MSCLSREQLVELILGDEIDPPSREHFKSCTDCQSRLESVRETVNQLRQMHDLSAARHQASRRALLNAMSVTQPVRIKSDNFRRVTHWLGGLTMRQRIALLTASLAPVLGFVLFWIAMNASPVVAMEEMAKQIREAKSYQFNLVQEMQLPAEAGKDPTHSKLQQKSYWKAPGAFRWEMTSADQFAGSITTKIAFTDRPGIELNPKEKTYQRVPAHQGAMSPLLMLQRLGSYAGEAEKQLGTRSIDGVEAVGFQLDAKEIDPDIPSGPVQVWLDPKSQLPVQLEMTMHTDGVDVTIRFESIRWNLELDPELFSTDPPEGYTDKTPPPTAVEKTVDRIRDGLKLYAEYHEGAYPRVKIVYGDVTRDSVREKMGFKGIPTREEFATERYQKLLDATWGYAALNQILRENPAAVWNGLTVDSEDKDKVLFRWKLEDGSYQVIFGDLSSENVTAGQLKVLESR